MLYSGGYSGLFFTIMFMAVNAQQSQPSCPMPHNFSDEVYIAFEKIIVPKIEVLLNDHANKMSTTDLNYINGNRPGCSLDGRSLARANIILGRMHYISNFITSNRRYRRAVANNPEVPLSSEIERMMRLAAAMAGETEASIQNSIG